VAIAAGLGDDALRAIVPFAAPVYAPTPAWYEALVVALALIVVVLSWWPVRNMLSRRQAMNASFNALHLVNTYGAFGSVGRQRDEVIVEGTLDGDPSDTAEWREYEFWGKPGDVRRRPPQVAPYHLRLDWLMWFLPLSPAYGEGWFVTFLVRLLENDRPTLRLLRTNPFPDAPPRFVRARLFRYEFTTRAERRATGAWWTRRPIGAFVSPVRLRAEDAR
jgi:hypothetical protein